MQTVLNGFERNTIHGYLIEPGFTHTPPCGWIDDRRTWSAEALWLVRWSWFHQNDAGLAHTGVQACVALDSLSDRGGVWRRPISRAWLLDAPGSSRGLRRYVHGDFQEP